MDAGCRFGRYGCRSVREIHSIVTLARGGGFPVTLLTSVSASVAEGVVTGRKFLAFLVFLAIAKVYKILNPILAAHLCATKRRRGNLMNTLQI